MNAITVLEVPNMTMTSREIAELTGKDLAHVHRDIRAMLDELKKDDPNLDHPREDKDSRGYTTCFHLKRELTETLLTGYSASARLKVIRRWHELEEQARNPIAALSRVDLLKLALDSEEQRMKLESRVVEMAPKVQALDRLALADGSLCIRDAAKTLQVQEKALKQTLISHKWLYRRPMGAGYLAYSEKLQQGLVEHKITRGEKGDGSEWIDTQARITAKGMVRLAKELSTGMTQ
jgi:phage antirepressor YoqD-like protein